MQGGEGMEIYDVSRELLTAEPYPGDPRPSLERIRSMEAGEEYMLSAFYACCHSGTHADAPLHYIRDGKNAAEIPLSRCFGACTLLTAGGILTGQHMDQILPYCEKRILFRGDGGAFLTPSAAFALSDAGILLVGTDAPSIASPDAEGETHRELLEREIVILEGLCFDNVPDGTYLLAAFPIKIHGAEGAPVRAVLIRDDNNE